MRDYDPRRALDGGADGLAPIARSPPTRARLLAPGGMLVVEIGAGQADAVAALFAAGGLAVAAPRRDLADLARVMPRARDRRADVTTHDVQAHPTAQAAKNRLDCRAETD